MKNNETKIDIIYDSQMIKNLSAIYMDAVAINQFNYDLYTKNTGFVCYLEMLEENKLENPQTIIEVLLDTLNTYLIEYENLNNKVNIFMNRHYKYVSLLEKFKTASNNTYPKVLMEKMLYEISEVENFITLEEGSVKGQLYEIIGLVNSIIVVIDSTCFNEHLNSSPFIKETINDTLGKELEEVTNCINQNKEEYEATLDETYYEFEEDMFDDEVDPHHTMNEYIFAQEEIAVFLDNINTMDKGYIKKGEN